MDIIKTIACKIGIDGAVAYSSGSRIVGGVAGVISIFFISTFLTGVEQGFYFTFGSILALQVFFELGLTGIMTQYVAYEVSNLNLVDNGVYIGEEKYRSRLASLIRFCTKWYAIMSIIVFAFLLVVGFFYFSRYGSNHTEVSWLMPWLLICFGTAIKLFQAPFISIFTGMGKVKEMSKIGFYQQLIIPVTTWIGLISGIKLYVIGIGYLLSVIIWQIYVNRIKLDVIILRLWKTKITERVSYFSEIFPYQWKIALSWVSGYFMFQLFNPVLFATEGAVVAGQMGMTLTALNAILTISYSWMNTKIPIYSSYIAKKDYRNLDMLFNKTLSQEVFACIFLLISFFLILCFLTISDFNFNGSLLADRFLSFTPTLLMAIPVFLQQFINSWATYLRCHKREPFLTYSIVGGIAVLLSTLVFGSRYGLYGITISYCVISILLFPWGLGIFRYYRNKWHNTTVPLKWTNRSLK